MLISLRGFSIATPEKLGEKPARVECLTRPSSALCVWTILTMNTVIRTKNSRPLRGPPRLGNKDSGNWSWITQFLHCYIRVQLRTSQCVTTMRADSAFFGHWYGAVRAFAESPHRLSPVKPVGDHQGDNPGEHQDRK